MLDREFKRFRHNCEGFTEHSSGGSVDSGYHPDYVLRSGNDFVILECERASSRKHFVGGLIKAAHFLRGERKGSLIFVLVERRNTKAESIAKHLAPYLSFVRPISNLTQVYVIEAEKYCAAQKTATIFSRAFLRHAIAVGVG